MAYTHYILTCIILRVYQLFTMTILLARCTYGCALVVRTATQVASAYPFGTQPAQVCSPIDFVCTEQNVWPTLAISKHVL